MNFKLHFLKSHLQHFPDNLGDYSEEQGERFHQDFCWMLKREHVMKGKKRKRNPLHRSFEDKKVRKSKRSKTET